MAPGPRFDLCVSAQRKPGCHPTSLTQNPDPVVFFSALLELMCDLVYNITTARVYRTVQELVFEAVLKQELAFFDSRKPGNPPLPGRNGVCKGGKESWGIVASAGELVSHITTSTNTMSEMLSQEMSYLMWYVSRFVFLLFFMLTQSWKMLLLTCMGLPICWVIAKWTGSFQEVRPFQTLLPCICRVFLDRPPTAFRVSPKDSRTHSLKATRWPQRPSPT